MPRWLTAPRACCQQGVLARTSKRKREAREVVVVVVVGRALVLFSPSFSLPSTGLSTSTVPCKPNPTKRFMQTRRRGIYIRAASPSKPSTVSHQPINSLQSYTCILSFLPSPNPITPTRRSHTPPPARARQSPHATTATPSPPAAAGPAPSSHPRSPPAPPLPPSEAPPPPPAAAAAP